MIRNLKALGLALVAVCAMSAMAASTAQATKPAGVTLGAGTTSVHMRTHAVTPGVFSRLGRTVSCKKGEMSASPANGATTITTTVPTFAECTSPSLGKPATVTMNGCHFLFHLTGSPGSPEDIWSATSDLVCPAGKEVTIEIYNDAAHKEVLCKFHFASQAGKEHLTLTNKAAGTKFPAGHAAVEAATPQNWVEAHINTTAIKSTRTTGSILTCGAALDETGSLTATAEIFGTNNVGGQTGVTISTHP